MIRLVIPPKDSRKIGDTKYADVDPGTEVCFFEITAGDREAKVISWIRALTNILAVYLVIYNPEKVNLAAYPKGEFYQINALIPSSGSMKICLNNWSMMDFLVGASISYYGWMFPDPDLFFGIGVKAP